MSMLHVGIVMLVAGFLVALLLAWISNEDNKRLRQLSKDRLNTIERIGKDFNEAQEFIQVFVPVTQVEATITGLALRLDEACKLKIEWADSNDPRVIAGDLQKLQNSINRAQERFKRAEELAQKFHGWERRGHHAHYLQDEIQSKAG